MRERGGFKAGSPSQVNRLGIYSAGVEGGG